VWYLQGAIEINSVSFAYPARPEVPVFRNLCLQVQPGQTVALVGPSGCGKSTVIQLLQRFYDPASGVVAVDGVDIRKYSLEWYRNQVRSHVVLSCMVPPLCALAAPAPRHHGCAPLQRLMSMTACRWAW
jgi:ABC-type multidrug transport system fused ATPase/permease subunit